MMIKHLTFTASNGFHWTLINSLKTEPGAIYRVTIGFRPEYSLYSRSGTDTTQDANNDDEEIRR